MPRTKRLFAILVFWVVAVIGKSVAVQADPPVPLIFDTDLGNDVDDVLAMGVIHALQSRGECELLAVTITKDHELAAPFADAINTFYGRGDIPIGVCHSGVTPHEGSFNGLAEVQDEEEDRFPHDLRRGSDVPDAIEVLRQALSDAKDNSVVIAQVGFSTNLADLLDAPADDVSPLTGRELIEKKVKMISVMAGTFTKIRNDQGVLYDHKEYNVIKDLQSAQKLSKEWPTPILWSGYEIGIALRYPHQSIEQDYGYVMHHPLSEAYVAYKPPPHDRPTWDLTCVLQLVRPDRDYFGLSPRGTVRVASDGVTGFEEDASGRDRYLMLSEPQAVRTLEALQMLASQPPH
ncbi:nucleoside hydrolase [Rhodopirellula sallentina]|uniref:Inosine/uridine-preferring nucleoside hydrolase n=1 Tax=Rhodopirellula sallentina SM41 TaxID=1263870 RepID=M5U6S0_9BACT|nr:nucleoside hydrolase [Rhodopirellula sallentina]EMI57167.1 inosine/uridine-preferring nucleoside hydrolase [Rhodopirellula sallentina SM41]